MGATIDLASKQGWETMEAELPEDFEALAKEAGVLEVQYGPAKITTASELLRLILLHVGADLKLRQTVALIERRRPQGESRHAAQEDAVGWPVPAHLGREAFAYR